MPLADGLLRADQLQAPEPKYALEVAICSDCSLVQILDTVPPEKLYQDAYPYYSSFSDALLAHSRENVESLIAAQGLDESSLVVELASNDGYLLQYYLPHKVTVLGIDPAEGPAIAAREKGVNTLNAFFGIELAKELVANGTRADVVHGNNVLAHVADLNGFVEGISILLKENGVAVIEVPYVVDLIDHCEFDTIYHEHHCYFSVTSLTNLFKRHGLSLNQVQPLNIHGGSLRLFVGRTEDVQHSVVDLLKNEEERGVTRFGYYRDFGQRVMSLKGELLEILHSMRREGKRMAGYGAAAKGAILLNYFGIGKDLLEFVADRNVHKQGRYMPGVHIPVVDPARIRQDMPDCVLILPWNFKDEIMEQQADYRAAGGKFLVPIPEPRFF
jgi:SAM-dependent methyltransferase